MSLVVGLGGATHNACVAVRTPTEFVGVCEQERVTRVRNAGVSRSGLPDEALSLLLQRAGRQLDATTVFAAAEGGFADSAVKPVLIDHHRAHAYTAFLPSSFENATIVVCDHDSPEVTVWEGVGTDVRQVDWPWSSVGFARLYSECADVLGFGGHDQRLEALCRVAPIRHDDALNALFAFEMDRLEIAPQWRARVTDRIPGGDHGSRAAVGAALQRRVGDLLLEFLTAVSRRVAGRTRLCVGGSLFLNSYFNARVKRSGLFDDVFVPINPSNAGLSVGAALHVSESKREAVSPFLGPSYTSEEIKSTLDNCKLTYNWASDADRVQMAVKALQSGRLVAWFDGAMEWGPRALGHRSIVANPLAPYALENLNRFLKNREPWRGYALSGLEQAVHERFDGPASSSFMECDYQPKDRAALRHILPSPDATVRVQTVGATGPRRFRALLEAFGDTAGIPLLVNTSFNGFGESIVCSPRDAIRVFYGTGIDMLVLGEFVVTK